MKAYVVYHKQLCEDEADMEILAVTDNIEKAEELCEYFGKGTVYVSMSLNKTVIKDRLWRVRFEKPFRNIEASPKMYRKLRITSTIWEMYGRVNGQINKWDNTWTGMTVFDVTVSAKGYKEAEEKATQILKEKGEAI
jgi:hypothetical protein